MPLVLPLSSFKNRMLSAIPPDELARLRPNLTRMRLANGDVIFPAGDVIGTVLFVEEGIISIVAETDRDMEPVEVGVVGFESMVGLEGLLSPEPRSFNQAMVQMPGVGYSMPLPVLMALLDRLPVLHRLLLREIVRLLAQVMQTAACNGRHRLSQRLARWLLLAHDRAEGDELPLTQEFLSIMLAVRRSGVSVAVQALKSAGVIEHRRGRMRVVDRAGLEGCACGCYRRMERFTATLSPPEAA